MAAPTVSQFSDMLIGFWPRHRMEMFEEVTNAQN